MVWVSIKNGCHRNEGKPDATGDEKSMFVPPKPESHKRHCLEGQDQEEQNTSDDSSKETRGCQSILMTEYVWNEASKASQQVSIHIHRGCDQAQLQSSSGNAQK